MSHSSRPFTVALGLAGALLLSTAGHAQDSGNAASQQPAAAQEQDKGADAQSDVVATLGDRKFTNADVAIAAEDLSDTLQQLPADQREAYLLTYLADLQRIADAARKANVQDDPGFKQRMQYMRDRTLMEAYLQQVGEQAATDEAAHKLYDEKIASAEPQQEVRASHILVPTEEEAKKLKKQLDEGADFAELAKENSKDPGSAPKGGDLGYFTADQMVPEFSDKAFALEPGQVSDPVQSQFGWHIIKLQDKREKEKPSYDDVEAQLKSTLARQAQRDVIMALREKSQLQVVGQDGSDLAGEGQDAQGSDAQGQDAPAATDQGAAAGSDADKGAAGDAAGTGGSKQ